MVVKRMIYTELPNAQRCDQGWPNAGIMLRTRCMAAIELTAELGQRMKGKFRRCYNAVRPELDFCWHHRRWEKSKNDVVLL